MITSNGVLTVIAIGLATIAGILMIVAVASARRAQRAAYYVVRRREQQHANRLFLWSVALFAVSAGVFISSRIMPHAIFTLSLPLQVGQAPIRPTDPVQTSAAAASTSTPTSTPAAFNASGTPASTSTRSAKDATATAAVGASPTPTPTPAQPPAPPTPLPRLMTLRAIGSELGPSGLPVSPTAEFTAGARSIYVVYDYRNVPAGALVRHNWLRDGGSVHFSSFTWDRLVDGATHIVWTQRKPFQPGTYEVRVFVDNSLQFVANFIVK